MKDSESWFSHLILHTFVVQERRNLEVLLLKDLSPLEISQHGCEITTTRIQFLTMTYLLDIAIIITHPPIVFVVLLS